MLNLRILFLACALFGCNSLEPVQSDFAQGDGGDLFVLPLSDPSFRFSLAPHVDVSYRVALRGEETDLLALSEQDLEVVVRLISEEAAATSLGLFVEDYVEDLQGELVKSINDALARDVVVEVKISQVAWLEYLPVSDEMSEVWPRKVRMSTQPRLATSEPLQLVMPSVRSGFKPRKTADTWVASANRLAETV